MRLASWLVPVCSLALLAGSHSGAAAQSLLKLNEFVAGPAQDWDGNGTFSSRDDEWIEVINTGSTPVDLSAYFITDGDSIPRYAFTGSLAPAGRMVVFGGQSVEWERATGHPVFGFSLANSGDRVLLWQITGADTSIVDGYIYRSHEAASDRAVGRSNDVGAWELFDGLNPYTGATPPPGNLCNPSPGGPNVCHVTSVRKVSWGRLKTIYR